jgi:hypothetical protein
MPGTEAAEASENKAPIGRLAFPGADGASVSTSQVPGLELPHVTIGLQKMSSKPYALANPVMTKRSVFWSQYFYFFMSLLVAAVIVYGFSHTIDQNLIHPKIPRPRLLYFHAALFTGWCFSSCRAYWCGRTTCGFTGRSDGLAREWER